jgi:hypothetical protein
MITVICTKGNVILDAVSVPEDGMEDARLAFINLYEKDYNLADMEFRYMYFVDGKVQFFPNRT